MDEVFKGFTVLKAEEARPCAAERRVLASVLSRAVEDVKRKRFFSFEQKKHFVEAWLWFASDREDYPMSFLCVCQGLNMEPHRIRRQLGVRPTDSLYGWKDIPTRIEGDWEPEQNEYVREA